MAGSTVNYGWPFPTGGDAVVVHTDIKNLAAGADASVLQTNARITEARADVAALRDEVAALAGLEPGEVSDATVAGLVAQGGSLTRASLDALYQGGGYPVDAASYGLVADSVTDDSPAIQAAIAGMPEGGVLVFPPGASIRLGSVVDVNRPVTISGGRFLTATGQAFNVSSTDVRIDGVTIDGPGADTPYEIRNHGIHAEGTIEAKISVEVTNCTIRGMRDSAIWLQHVRDFVVANNHVEGFRYAGIWVSDGRDGRIAGNTVRDGVYNGSTECYGMALTGPTVDTDNQSENIIVSYNHVLDIPRGKGLDTHGGKSITFAFNQVHGCATGIAGTVGNYNRYTAPTNLVIIGNTITGDTGSAVTTSGISAGGADSSHPLGALWADVMAMSNAIRDVDIPINLPGARGEHVDPALSQFKHNTSNVFPILEMPVDTGGVEVIIEHLGDGVYRIGE